MALPERLVALLVVSVVANEDHWDELARRWLRAYPEQWVDDVGAFVETHLAHEGGLAEPSSGREDEM